MIDMGTWHSDACTGDVELAQALMLLPHLACAELLCQTSSQLGIALCLHSDRIRPVLVLFQHGQELRPSCRRIGWNVAAAVEALSLILLVDLLAHAFGYRFPWRLVACVGWIKPQKHAAQFWPVEVAPKDVRLYDRNELHFVPSESSFEEAVSPGRILACILARVPFPFSHALSPLPVV